MAGDNEEIGSLSAEDQAYFSSRGETEVKPEPQKEPETVVDPDVEAELAEDDITDAPAADGQVEPKKLVPLTALTRERKDAKELRARLSEIEKENAVLADRWNMILKANEAQAQQPAKDEDPEPDPNTDIFAHNQWLKRQVEALRTSNEQTRQADQQAKQAEEQETKVWNFWHQSAAAYKAETPDFNDAVTWMSTERTRQLKALSGLQPQFKTEEGIVRQINSELKDIVIAAAQGGVSPAEYIYSMAKEWGYTPKQAAQTTEAAIAALTKTEQNITAATSLSSASGTRPNAALDPQAIANMSPSEFESWLSKNGEKGFRKMAGG